MKTREAELAPLEARHGDLAAQQEARRAEAAELERDVAAAADRVAAYREESERAALELAEVGRPPRPLGDGTEFLGRVPCPTLGLLAIEAVRCSPRAATAAARSCAAQPTSRRCLTAAV